MDAEDFPDGFMVKAPQKMHACMTDPSTAKMTYSVTWYNSSVILSFSFNIRTGDKLKNSQRSDETGGTNGGSSRDRCLVCRVSYTVMSPHLN